MKTLLVTLEFPPFHGGIASYYGNLAQHWKEGELEVINNNDSALQAKNGFFPWRRAFAAIWRRLPVDHVLVGHLLPLGTVVYLLSLLRPFRYSVFLHGLDFNSAMKTRRKRFLAGLILRRAQKIVAANSYAAALAGAFYPAGKTKISVANPGVAGPATAPVLAPAAKYALGGRLVLLSIGRLVKRKGFDRTIEAIARMTEDERRNLSYLIAGTGPDETYLKSLVPPYLQNQISFLGGVSEEEKWCWLERADALIMPARDIDGDVEGFGIVYLEANLLGKPVIAGDSGGVRDAVTDGENGLLVDPENVDNIKAAILKLANNRELREQLGHRGRERAKEGFSWPRQAAKIEELVTGVI